MDLLYFLTYLPELLDIAFKAAVILACVKYLRSK